MNYNLKLLALTTLFITIAANSAHAHAIDGAEAGLLHLVSNMDHMLVLLMTVFSEASRSLRVEKFAECCAPVRTDTKRSRSAEQV